jgi:hypothetical protein
MVCLPRWPASCRMAGPAARTASDLGDNATTFRSTAAGVPATGHCRVLIGTEDLAKPSAKPRTTPSLAHLTSLLWAVSAH